MDLLGWLLATRSDHRTLLRATEAVQSTANRVLAVVHRMEANMATQEQVDALTASVQEASSRIGDGVGRANTSLDAVRQDIADIKSANPSVDLSALESSVGNLSDAVAPLSTLADNLSELDTENPALPPAEPAPAPVEPAPGDEGSTGQTV